jgi:hypothetical protein
MTQVPRHIPPRFAHGGNAVCERQYRLTDLAALSGASFAQIKRWIGEQTVTGAVKAGRYSYYPQQSLDDIRAVMECYEGNMTIADIRDRLANSRGRSDDGDNPPRP